MSESCGGRGWPRVIALGRAADTGSMIDACRAGASGVLCGPTDGAVDDKPRAIPALTDREVEVLEWVADGRSNQWIAEQLTLPLPDGEGSPQPDRPQAGHR